MCIAVGKKRAKEIQDILELRKGQPEVFEAPKSEASVTTRQRSFMATGEDSERELMQDSNRNPEEFLRDIRRDI